MKTQIQHQLTHKLLLSLAMLTIACGTQTSGVRGPQTATSSLGHINLINDDRSINLHLLAFMELFDLAHENSITSVNKALQTNFLRKKGIERQDIKDHKLDQQRRHKGLQLLQKMDLIDKIDYQPDCGVDYFLLFGAMTTRMVSRIKDFVKQCENGMKCKHVVLLGGVRKLRDTEIAFLKSLKIDFPTLLHKLGKKEAELTEADAFRVIWDIYVPQTIRKHFEENKNLAFINSTDVSQGTNGRPTTGPTLEAWYNTCHPAPGHCHGNVEMPYAVRMEKVLRGFLQTKEKGFSISWNSPAASKTLPMGVYKDTLARTFYEECKLKGYI